MSTDIFELHIQQSLQKLEDLWQRTGAIPTPDSKLWQSTRELPQQQQQVLRESLEELSASIEELQLATETLKQQNTDLLANHQPIEAQLHYYQELFHSAPDCYIVTTKNGTIKEVNQKTTELLGVSAKYLNGKALAVFIPVAQRQDYYKILNQIKQGQISQATWQLEINPRQQNSLNVEFTVNTMRDLYGKVTNLRWRISPVICERNEKVNSTLIEHIRYPIYNLATQIEEIQTSNLENKQSDRRWQEISNDLLKLQYIVDNAYILLCLPSEESLNPSLVDYTVFVKRAIKKIQQHKIVQQQIVVNSQDSCVGICDVFLLERIITNILNSSAKYVPVDSQIQIYLTKNPVQYLNLQIKALVRETIIEELPTIFEPLVSDRPIELISSSDLSLAVIRKCVSLLQGKIELEYPDTISFTITVKLPVNMNLK